MKTYFTFIFVFLAIFHVNSQNDPIAKLEDYLDAKNTIECEKIISSINPKDLTNEDKAKFYSLKGNLYTFQNKDNLALNNFLLSKIEYKKIGFDKKVADVNLEIVSLLLAINPKENSYQSYLDEYLKYALKTKDPNIICENYSVLAAKFYDDNIFLSQKYYLKALDVISKTKNIIKKGIIIQNIGVTFSDDRIGEYNKALNYFFEANKIFQSQNSTENLFNSYINIGLAYHKKEDFNNALLFYKKALVTKSKTFEKKNGLIVYKLMSSLYEDIEDYKTSNIYLKKSDSIENILNENEMKIAIKEIDTKYLTAENNLKIVSLEKGRIVLYSVISLFSLIIFASFISYKNLSKKKKIIEQEKLLETQKLETTLKEQELHEIDVMLESQEKERQRIANELHDNLGSMLATLKLNFENLKRNDSTTTDSENNLFEKTDDLIEEAYQKVRNIAHLKNLGVIGSEGLVVAVKKMAEKMSVIEKLQINVIPHGLNERLENTLEITLFRMIQELCTNIIKHSKATEVNIYLTQHNDNELNVIIEDNGKGFNPKDVVAKDGIGLKSIEKKVEQMNGTFTIDSIISKGTTIIIDLPI